jgi:membrane fusion protein, heavy metal efflux system
MKARQVLALVALIAAGVAGAYWFYAESPPEAENKPVLSQEQTPGLLRFPAGAPQLAYVKVTQAVAFPEPLIAPLNGRIAYDENRTARVSSPISGRVVKIEVETGQEVKAGQPLLVLSSPDFNAALADSQKAEAELARKRQAFLRAKTLFNGEVLARRDYESSEADLREAEAEAKRARQRVQNLTQGRKAEGDHFMLRAPISGVVAERRVNPGAEVRPDLAEPLFVITDPSHVWVLIDLPERHIGRVQVGQYVLIDVDAYPGLDFSGEIVSMGAALDPQTRRVQARAVADNPRGRLKPEMFAQATPVADLREKLVRVPNSALISEGLYSFVFVEKEPGVFEKRRVVLGLQGREESYIKQGIEEGERVVITGALALNSELAAGG